MTLKVYLLGQFNLQASGRAVELPSRPAQSLLAYLVLNAGVTVRREKLASLLWPESSEPNARSYLRQALWRIRKALSSSTREGEDYLTISDISVSFNDRSDYWLDVAQILNTTNTQSIDEIITVVRLYRGELLPGFYDEWIVLERDRLLAAYHRKMNFLIEALLEAVRWQDVLEWGEEWIRYGYSPEPAFRALMRAHAGLGNSGMVTGTYHRCVDSLDRELSIEPSLETKQLYEQIRHGAWTIERTPAALPAAPMPSFLSMEEPGLVEKPVFVARERELTQLDEFLELAINGRGRTVFVTGEAGNGKTALIAEFVRRALNRHADVIVAGGNCNAYTGMGDPYLPFRQILELLAGEVEARWMAGAVTGQQARLLWKTFPMTVRAMVNSGPDLINTFVSGTALVDRVRTFSPEFHWIERLEDLVQRRAASSIVPGLQQNDLFEQYTRVMQILGRKIVLVLVLDDLQWADMGSISLLFHLGRQIGFSRILVVGAYRSEELALGREGSRHPLEPVVNEFRRMFGNCEVNLDQTGSQDFVDALLESEPNRLGLPFRQMLYRQTRGHPLFTIELLRGMQERGDLLLDRDGHWVEGPALDWETLPARVEAVITERIGRLPQPLRAALRVASVEGEIFTAEVVTRVRSSEEWEMLRFLRDELDRKHRLIRAHSVLRIDGQLLSFYQFRHALYQKYLYGSLDEVERVHLHEQVGMVLEDLYRQHEESQSFSDIAPQLARHFREAKILMKAIHYLRRAGERAVQLSAYQEAVPHFTQSLALLKSLPASSENVQQELALQLSLGWAWMAKGTPNPQSKAALMRARQLCLHTGKTPQLCHVLNNLSVHYYVRAEYSKALSLAQEALELARKSQDSMLIAMIHWHIGFVRFGLGNYSASHEHLGQMISFYKPEEHHRPLVVLHGLDGGLSALAYDASCLWCLGYPDQAERRSKEALELARARRHPFTLADVICYGGCMLYEMRRDVYALKSSAEELIRVSSETDFPGWRAIGTIYLGQALAMLGQPQEGTVKIQQGMDSNRSLHVGIYLPGVLRSLAEAYVRDGQSVKGLSTLEDALLVVEQTGERHWEAELYRLRGELLLEQGDEAEAEASLNHALIVARRQRARSWELRSATTLAQLWQKQGRIEEARRMLAEIYSWFTEGFTTPDLVNARSLLDELG